MKRALLLCAAAVIGLAVGLGTALLLSAFFPVCGEDCSNRTLVTFLWTMGGAVLSFALASWHLSRRTWPAPARVVGAWAVLGALFLLPAGAYYVHSLHGEYRRLQTIAPVEPTADFFHMAIATRDVKGFTEARQGPVRPMGTIPQWERCLIGIERCDTSPRQVEVFCKVGVMNINEADWLAFALIPSENSPGIEPLKSMHLCSE
jgi:hypothetical protein